MNPRDERATSLPRRQRIPIELVIALVGTAAMLALSLAGCNVPAKISADGGAAAVDAHHGNGSNAGTDAGTAKDAPATPPADAPTTPPVLDAATPAIDAPLPPPADAAVDAAADAT